LYIKFIHRTKKNGLLFLIRVFLKSPGPVIARYSMAAASFFPKETQPIRHCVLSQREAEALRRSNLIAANFHQYDLSA
jgi:hypothetical protein